VDDLFQETWLRVIRGQSNYRPDAPFGAYLYRIAHNVLIDHYRKESHVSRPSPVVFSDPADPAADPQDAYARQALRATFVAALETLPAEQREAYLLHEEAGLTLAQIAEVVGTGRETIKSRIRYAVAHLKAALDSESQTVGRRA
jgi:RNA polymerase sigma-70 factor (ECF subfamily)